MRVSLGRLFHERSRAGVDLHGYVDQAIPPNRTRFAPVEPNVYNAILDELATMDIVCKERVGEL